MENGKFKTLKAENGKAYIFNHRAFKLELRKVALAAKKDKSVSSIEEFEEGLADKLAVSTAAIKQWKFGYNGVSDIERVQEIAEYLGLDDYRVLLSEVEKVEEKDDVNMNNNYFEEERNAAREVFNSLISVINAYKDTGAYMCFGGVVGVPTQEEVLDINDTAGVVIQRARFDMPKETFTQLETLLYEISSTVPEDLKVENNPDLKGDLPYWITVERKADEYFEELCKILERYIR